MGDVDYPGCFLELYQSEVLGEAAFLALLKVARNARERYHFATFLQLETETKARLRPYLLEQGLELDETLEESDTVPGIVALYQQSEWLEFLAQLRPLIEQFLARFKEIAAAGPAADRDILESMIPHEASFLHWIEKEAAGEDGALDPAIAQLRFPVRAPG